MNAPTITFDLSSDQALVLFEWLAQFDQAGSEIFRHHAEEKVVWKIEGILEERLDMLFEPNYKQLLAEAQKRIVGDEK